MLSFSSTKIRINLTSDIYINHSFVILQRLTSLLKVLYFITNVSDDGFVPVTVEHYFQRIQFIARNTTVHFYKTVLQVIVRQIHVPLELIDIAD